MGKFIIKTAANGQVAATSQVYQTETACRKGIESVCKNANFEEKILFLDK